MTAQTPEILQFNGQTLDLCAEPLRCWTNLQPPGFSFLAPDYRGARTTACHRGYVGHWRIMDGRLYLHGFEPPENDWRMRPFEEMFAGHAGRGVFAHWVEGVLRCNVGEIVDYVHHGYASQAEGDRYLLVERGVLRAQRDFPCSDEDELPWFWRGEEVLAAFGIATTDPRPPDDESDDLDDWEGSPLPIDKPGARVEPVTLAAAEALGHVHDPLGEVPRVPFGHLHAGWHALLAQLRPGDELRSVHVPIGTRIDDYLVRMEPLRAIAVIRQGQAVHHFVHAGGD